MMLQDVAIGRDVGAAEAYLVDEHYWMAGMGFAMLSATAFLLSTRHGIGILPDSARYMGLVARPWDAPLYPWLLAAVAWFGPAIEQTAKLIGLVLAALNGFLVWHILIRATRAPGHALVGTALVLFSPQFVGLHAVAMSEALFITTILLSLLALLHHWKTDKPGWLWACAAMIGLAALTRFTAPALAAAVVMTLLIDPRRQFQQRIGGAAIVGAVSGAIFFAWVGVSELVLGRSTGRPLRFYGNMDGAAWLHSFKSLTAWMAPDDVPLAMRAAIFLLTLAACCWLMVRYSNRVLARARTAQVGSALLPIALGFFFIFYLLLMVLATSIEANLHFNSRYAFPIQVTGVIMMTIVLADAKDWSRRLHAVLAIVALLVLAGHGLRTAYHVRDSYVNGIGYAALRWMHSPTLDAVRRLPPGTVIYSNGPDAIGYVTKRRAREIPLRFQRRTGRDDPDRPFAWQLEEFGRDMALNNGVLVFLDGVDWRFYMATEAELVRRFDLVDIGREKDGRIYAARHPGMN